MDNLIYELTEMYIRLDDDDCNARFELRKLIDLLLQSGLLGKKVDIEEDLTSRWWNS